MKSKKYILAIDHGTSGIKAALVSVDGKTVDFCFQKTDTIYLGDGGVEQDPEQWWTAVAAACGSLVSGSTVDRDDVAAVCVSSTFSTTVAVDRNGMPVMNAITWMDTRGGPYVKQAMAGFPSFEGYGIRKALKWIVRTGGAPTLTGKDDIGHVLFMMHERPDLYEKTYKFLPSKDFINLRLTGEFGATTDSVHLFWVTDIRDINNIKYDWSLVKEFGVDPDKLPDLYLPTDIIGSLCESAARQIGLKKGIPVVAGSPDHQCACIGSGAVRDYEAHLYIGTSSWVQCLVPFKKTDVLHSIASFPTAVPGRYQSVNEQDIAGGALDFLVGTLFGGVGGNNDLSGPDRYRAVDEAAAGAPAGSGGVIFTPWLNGERTPVDDEAIRGSLFNLSTTTTSDHVARAVMEGVAYNSRWALTYVEKFTGRVMDPITIVGGGAKSEPWCQIFADVTNRTIRRARDPVQANARGAAFIAAVALGYIRFDDIPGITEYDRVFKPDPDNREVYDFMYKSFLSLYEAHKRICRHINTREGHTT